MSNHTDKGSRAREGAAYFAAVSGSAWNNPAPNPAGIVTLSTANTSYTITILGAPFGGWKSSNANPLVSTSSATTKPVPIVPMLKGDDVNTAQALVRGLTIEDISDFAIAAQRRNEPDEISHEDLKKKYGLE
jgi:hypothetical protein